MPAERTCSQCGAPLPANAPGNRCPKCLLALALEDLGAERGSPEPQQAGTLPPAQSAPLPDSDILIEQTGTAIGRYKLLQQIGEGGFGVVFIAEQTEPVQRKVALKVIKAGMDTREFIARFEAERQALAMMDHPNIAKVLAAGATDSGRPFFVMELVRGIKITDYCDQNNLSTEERLKLFIQVCQAVQHAHQKGIIHRDIKPSNILVTLNDGAPVPKVIDFGIAKATTGQRLTDKTLFTAFEQFVGTPAYMSPEQAEMGGLDIDTRSDTYSLGVLLYELLTGKIPFDPQTLLKAGLDEMRRIIREQEPPRPSTRLSTLGDAELSAIAKHRHSEPPKLLNLIRGDLDWIVMKSLEKDRARRYETANGLAMDIRRNLNHEPVLARPASKLYRFQKMVRRHRLAFAAASAVAATLIAGMGVSTLFAFYAVKKSHEAKEEARKAAIANQILEIQRAQMLFAADDAPQGLAFLARALRQNPASGLVAYFLVNELSLRGLLLPASEPFQHADVLYSAEFSPGGRLIATASYDKTARIWDATTGVCLAGPLQHEGQIRSIRFSPDGLRVATASWDHTARIWDVRTGRPITDPLRHGDYVWSAQWSPDGRHLVTASYDGTAKIWDGETGEPVASRLHEKQVAWAEFSHDGRWVVTASWDHTAKVWDTRAGHQEPRHTLRHEREVWCARFSPDGQLVVTASWDNTARVWNAETGESLTTEPLRHRNAVLFAEFSPVGDRVLTASLDGTARIWEARTGKPVGAPMRHRQQLEYAQFSPDGLRVVTASFDHTARVWDAETGAPLSEPLLHGGEVRSARFSPDGQKLVTASDDHTARVWDVRLALRFTSLLTNTTTFVSFAFDSRGQPVSRDAAKTRFATSTLPPTPLPVPAWLPELAESVIGQEIVDKEADAATWRPDRSKAGAERMVSPVSPAAFLRLKRQGLRNSEVDFYSQWARWFVADPSVRTLSPASLATVSDYAHALLQMENSVADLREVVQLQPTNFLGLTHLARRLLESEEVRNPRRLGEAEWCSSRALELAPDHWEAWWSRAMVLKSAGRLTEAAGAIRRAAEQQPSDPVFWTKSGLLLDQAGLLNEAYAAVSQAIALCNDPGQWPERTRNKALLVRAGLLRQMDRLTEAIADNLAALEIPPRDPQTPKQLIDLSPYYNANLDMHWHRGIKEGFNLAKLPHGESSLGGIQFDVRGVVQLGSPSFDLLKVDFPKQISGIRIGLKVRRINFLHATGWAVSQGTRIGEYAVHYADGAKQTIGIIYGEDLRNWDSSADPRTDVKNATVAWTGVVQSNIIGHIYLRTWENPAPDVEVLSIDCESAMSACAPFLLGLTVE